MIITDYNVNSSVHVLSEGSALNVVSWTKAQYSDSGEFQEKRLGHREEAEKFYRALAGQKVRVGMEASGHARWFERLLAELQVELWIGDAAEIRTRRVRKQKTDRQDAQLILKLMLKDDFPQISPSAAELRTTAQQNLQLTLDGPTSLEPFLPRRQIVLTAQC